MMDAALLAQYLLVALAVIASAAFVFMRQFPTATRRLRIALAIPLLCGTRPAWQHWLGRRIAPPPTRGRITCGDCTACNDGGNTQGGARIPAK